MLRVIVNAIMSITVTPQPRVTREGPTKPIRNQMAKRAKDQAAPQEEQEMGVRVPLCEACSLPMMPRTREDQWFWGCQQYPTCRGPTKRVPPVPQALKEAARESWGTARREKATEEAARCKHPLCKKWGNASKRGSTCRLCGAVLDETGKETGKVSSSFLKKAGEQEVEKTAGKQVEEASGSSPTQEAGAQAEQGIVDKMARRAEAAQICVEEACANIKPGSEAALAMLQVAQGHLAALRGEAASRQ